MSEAIAYLWETCRDTPLCAYNKNNNFVPSSRSSSGQEGAEFIEIWKNYFRDAGVYLWPSSLIATTTQMTVKEKKRKIGSLITFNFCNKPLSGITRLDLIWSLQEPVVPNAICIFLSVHLFVLSVFSPLPSCEDCLPAAARAGRAASYQVPREEEFRRLGCSGQLFLAKEPLASMLRTACEDEEGKNFIPFYFVCLLAVPGCWKAASLKG